MHSLLGTKNQRKKMTQAQFPYWKWTSVNWQLKYTDVVKIALCVLISGEYSSLFCFRSTTVVAYYHYMNMGVENIRLCLHLSHSLVM